MNDELEGSCCCLAEVLSQNLSVGTDTNHEKHHSGQPVPRPQSEPSISRIWVGRVTATPTCSYERYYIVSAVGRVSLHNPRINNYLISTSSWLRAATVSYEKSRRVEKSGDIMKTYERVKHRRFTHTGSPLDRKLGKHQNRSGHCGEHKNQLPMPEIEPEFLGCLYRGEKTIQKQSE
jgi:hypothetical protein